MQIQSTWIQTVFPFRVTFGGCSWYQWFFQESSLILSVIFMETTWSAIHCFHSCKLSKCRFVLRQIGDLGLNDWVAYLRNLLSAAVDYFSEVFNIVNKLLLVVPATNAVSERSGSALRRHKTCLRTLTTPQERWNHSMILHVHTEMTDKLDIEILEISLFHHQITGKVALENSMSIKTFSNH